MENFQTSQPQKPVGVYILTICIFLRFGVFELITDLNAIQNTDQRMPLLIVIILVSRNVFLAGAAIWAYFGDNWGRILLLALVSINVLWTIFTVITYLSFKQDEPRSLQIIYSLHNPIFWLVVCWWYLNRRNVVEYYKSYPSIEEKALQ